MTGSARSSVPGRIPDAGGASPSQLVAGIVLAAGGSRRLGRAKQLLPLGDGVLLDRALDVARSAPLDQVVVALGAHASEIADTVDLRGYDVAINEDFGSGCSSSIAAAIGKVLSVIDVVVLLLGDQPGVRPETIAALLEGRGQAPLAVCRYDDGRGHPLAFSRSAFGDLASLHGDRGVWRLLDQRAAEVVEVRVPGPVPRDVDTWEDYEAVRAEFDVGAPGAPEPVGQRAGEAAP